MNCAHCGAAVVAVMDRCPSCRAALVDPDQLDSLLSMAPEPVPEDVDTDEPGDFEPLAVSAEIISERFLQGGVAPGTRLDSAGAPEPVGAAAGAEAPVPSSPEAGPVPDDPAPPSSVAAPLAGSPDTPAAERAERTEPAEPAPTGPRWGPRDHPPAVLAPAPPQPLEAPAVARVKKPSGTGLPPGLSGATAPGAATSPEPPSVPAPPGPGQAGGAAAPAEERTGRRRRGWFGRGREPEPGSDASTGPPAPSGADRTGSSVPPTEAAPAAPPVPPAEELFPGAPPGLLDGVVPEPVHGEEQRDPGHLDEAVSRVSAGARRAAQASLLVVATVLEDGEVAELAVQGSYQHRPGVVVLTDRRVVVANDRPWAPDIRAFALEPGLAVHGWQDERRAALVFVRDGVGVHVDAISDRPLARDLAQRVRARCGEGADGDAAG